MWTKSPALGIPRSIFDMGPGLQEVSQLQSLVNHMVPGLQLSMLSKRLDNFGTLDCFDLHLKAVVSWWWYFHPDFLYVPILREETSLKPVQRTLCSMLFPYFPYFSMFQGRLSVRHIRLWKSEADTVDEQSHRLQFSGNPGCVHLSCVPYHSWFMISWGITLHNI